MGGRVSIIKGLKEKGDFKLFEKMKVPLGQGAPGETFERLLVGAAFFDAVKSKMSQGKFLGALGCLRVRGVLHIGVHGKVAVDFKVNGHQEKGP